MSDRLSRRATPRSLRPRLLALHLALGGLATAFVIAAPAVHAQGAASAARSYDIPAGPLSAVLTRLVGESGLLLAASSEQTQGRTSPGLRGSFSDVAALETVLKGSGLEAVRAANGSFSLRTSTPPAPTTQPASAPSRAQTRLTPVSHRAPADDATALSTVHVNGRAERDAASEGTGAYTAKVASSATKMNLSLRETPQSVTVITSQMIEDNALTTMEQVLNHTPGISMVGDASENSQIFVRGFYLGTGILIDGLNTTSAQPIYDGSISQGLDPVIADRIEVVKGATGILAGLGEPSASVNFIRKRATKDFQAHGQLGAGRWGRWNAEGDVSGPLTEDRRVRARLVGAYRQGDSYIDRYSIDKQVVYGTVEADLSSRTTVTLAVDDQRSKTKGAFNYNSNPAFYTDGGLFDAGPSFSTGQDWTYWNVNARSVLPSIEHRFDNGWFAKLALRSAKADIDRVSFNPGEYVDRATGNLVGAWSEAYADRSLRHSKTDSVDAYATGPFELLGRKHELVVGGSYARNEFTMATFNGPTMAPYNLSSGAIAGTTFPAIADYDNGYDQRQSGAFATVRLNLADAWKLLLGTRLSNWKHTSSDRISGTANTVSHNSINTPYVGLVVDVSATTSAYASYTSTFRPVTNFGADGKLLDPAEGSNVEAGLKWSLLNDTLNASVAVYQTKEDNYPEYANAGKLPNGEWIYRSLDGIKTTGYELEISGRLTPRLDVSGGYTHNKAKDADGNRKLTYIPDDVLKLSASYRVTDAINVGGGLRWQSASFYETSIYAVDPAIAAVQRQKAYTLVDLMGRYRFSDRVSASVNVNNLFNKRYNRSLWGYADYGEPRNLQLSVRVDW